MGTMAAGWMGGIEVGKIVLGRDSQEAWLAGAIVPGGIMGIWTRNLYGGMRTSIFLGEDWTSPQGPWTVLEEVGGQGEGGVTGINIKALAKKKKKKHQKKKKKKKKKKK